MMPLWYNASATCIVRSDGMWQNRDALFTGKKVEIFFWGGGPGGGDGDSFDDNFVETFSITHGCELSGGYGRRAGGGEGL